MQSIHLDCLDCKITHFRKLLLMFVSYFFCLRVKDDLSDILNISFLYIDCFVIFILFISSLIVYNQNDYDTI